MISQAKIILVFAKKVKKVEKGQTTETKLMTEASLAMCSGTNKKQGERISGRIVFI